MTSHGQKVTSDPEAQRRVGEAGGLVTSDSLAAESAREGGSFGANNERVGISDQPSYSTTSNTTDTSDARRLDPAVDAEAREAETSWKEELDVQPRDKSQGIGPTYNIGETGGSGYSGGESTSRSTRGGGESESYTRSSNRGNDNDNENTSSEYTRSSTGGANSYNERSTGRSGGAVDVDAAPTYVDVQQNPHAFRDEGQPPKPHGKNITEGGFDSDAPNASFNTTDIGGKDDPGREAMRKTERSSADAGYERDTKASGRGQYGNLGDEQA